MKRQVVYSTLLFCFISPFLIAQTIKESTTEALFEKIAEAYETVSEEEMEILYDELERLLNNPVNLNTATRDELEPIVFLNDTQIDRLIAYRSETGQIYSIYELNAIEGFDPQTIGLLKHFVSFEPTEANFRSNLTRHQVNLSTAYTFEKAGGFREDDQKQIPFEGIAPRLSLKYQGKTGKGWEWGLVAENDPGEGFFSGNNLHGFDFYSGYVALEGKKLLQKLIFGDFQVKSGQGLVFGSGYGGRKSVESIHIRTGGQGIRPSLSANENNPLRGIAALHNTGRFDIFSFYAINAVDAHIASADETGKPSGVSSFQTSGLHRTGSENSGEDALLIQMTGARAGYSLPWLTTGITGGYSWLSCPVIPDERLYNRFYFRGKENFNLSADATARFKRVILFGEGALCHTGGGALLTGCELFPNNWVALHLLYRNFSKDFHSLMGNSFSEWSGNRNEEGFFSAISLSPFPGVTLNAYLDLYSSHYLRYNSIAPVYGNDFSLQCNFQPSRNSTLYFRVKSESSNGNSTTPGTVKSGENKETNRFRIHFDHAPGANLKLRFRAEWTGVSNDDSLCQGWLFLADLGYASPDERFSATGRLAWFNTHDYDSGIYTYENDVPSSFYIPVFYLNGLRYYLNLKVVISKNCTVWAKISQTRYFGQTEIGSGHGAIEGNHKTEAKLYLRFRF